MKLLHKVFRKLRMLFDFADNHFVDHAFWGSNWSRTKQLVKAWQHLFYKQFEKAW